MNLIERIWDIAREDGRYSAEAFLFVFRALDHTVKNVSRRRPPGHVTGAELLRGIAELARQEFGFLARTVFEGWGVRDTLDFGRIVFVLVEAEMMGRNDNDTIEDFRDVYDFEDMFERGFTIDWNEVVG